MVIADGDYLAILSTRQNSRTTNNARLTPEIADAFEGEDIAEEKREELVLSLWRWSSTSPLVSPESPPLTSARVSVHPRLQQVVMTTLLEEEVQIWRVESGPLGRRFVCHTFGFGLLSPETVHTMWCLALDAVSSERLVMSIKGYYKNFPYS
ncbi:hypothetical protein Hamer_G014731 [Homarus americanus]|uniref:Uncharacterized protein n=1 Tax=Homarus americanus TaxID=6706 RepID=A0A8J5N1S3_HOMAM|nr:hypothetical protein Hamer_G014731 [Homarus americanus]